MKYACYRSSPISERIFLELSQIELTTYLANTIPPLAATTKNKRLTFIPSETGSLKPIPRTTRDGGVVQYVGSVRDLKLPICGMLHMEATSFDNGKLGFSIPVTTSPIAEREKRQRSDPTKYTITDLQHAVAHVSEIASALGVTISLLAGHFVVILGSADQ